jgi:hypothetical protein
MFDEHEAFDGIIIGKGNRSTGKKPTPVSLCPPQIPHDLGSNPSRRDGKLAVNSLSYVTAYIGTYIQTGRRLGVLETSKSVRTSI